jgi:hypothetical protein
MSARFIKLMGVWEGGIAIPLEVLINIDEISLVEAANFWVQARPEAPTTLQEGSCVYMTYPGTKKFLCTLTLDQLEAELNQTLISDTPLLARMKRSSA